MLETLAGVRREWRGKLDDVTTHPGKYRTIA
jgi:hypothetical protein